MWALALQKNRSGDGFSTAACRILACHSPSLRCASSLICILIGCAVSSALIGCLWVWLRNSGFLFQCGWVDVRGGLWWKSMWCGFFFSSLCSENNPQLPKKCFVPLMASWSARSTNPATTTNHWKPSVRATIPCGLRVSTKWPLVTLEMCSAGLWSLNSSAVNIYCERILRVKCSDHKLNFLAVHLLQKVCLIMTD